MASLSNKQADIIEAINSMVRYLDNLYFEGMVSQIYPLVLQLNRANVLNTEASFFWIYINVFLTVLFPPKCMIDKRDDFDLNTVNFPVFDGDGPRCTSYGTFHNL